MTLISSVSGIRGTIGGLTGQSLTPPDIVRFTVAYGQMILSDQANNGAKVVIGRDARQSGKMINRIVTGVLMGMGIDVVDLDLVTTPTVEMAVPKLQANGGIILTASHNPFNWNALKLLNEKGEFISVIEGNLVLELSKKMDFDFVETLKLGNYVRDNSLLENHIDEILALSLVDVDAIRKAGFKIGVDAVNSVGNIAIPELLKKLGIKTIEQVFDTIDGDFQREAEPLNENLTDLGVLVSEKKLDIGIAVDPDVDRLALVSEKGIPIGEENTLVLVADYVLSHQKGALVANMSSTMALNDIASKHGVMFKDSAVGEVHVVEAMKKNQAVIGGEGNGGVIYPELHYGRDALVGIALLLAHLANSKKKLSEMVSELPNYFMRKEKIELSQNTKLKDLFFSLKNKNTGTSISEQDGLKIYYSEGWVHLRKSNTEPIIRLYAEHRTVDGLQLICNEIYGIVSGLN